MKWLQGGDLTKRRIFLLKQYLRFKAFLGTIDYIVVFFVALLLFSLASLFFFRQYGTNYSHSEELAQLEIIDFTLNRFDDSHVNMFVRSDRAMQYKKDEEVYINFFGSRFNEDKSTETLEGQEVWHRGDIYDFVAGIQYTKTPNTTFFSEQGVYDTKKEVFQGRGNFFIDNTEMTTHGKDIFYDKITDTITAKQIQTKLF